MLENPEILYSHLADGSIEPVYLWRKDVDTQQPGVVIIHDLYEDLGFYTQDINWWVERNHPVYGVNIHYYGSRKRTAYAGSFEKVCYNVLQILALIRSHHAMRPPLVYTRGMGALVVTRIARKNTKFISGMIAFGPLYGLKKPPQGLQEYVLQSLNAMAPAMRIPKFLMPRLSEQDVVSSLVKHKMTDNSAYLTVNSADADEKTALFTQLARNEWLRTLAAYPLSNLAEARLTFGALQDYLKMMKSSARLCSRLKFPCLFILPSHSDYLDYRLLYQVQKKFGAMMRFEIQRETRFDDLVQPTSSTCFDDVAQKFIIPWYEHAFQGEAAYDQLEQAEALSGTSAASFDSLNFGDTHMDFESSSSDADQSSATAMAQESTVIDHTLGAEVDETHDSQMLPGQAHLKISNGS